MKELLLISGLGCLALLAEIFNFKRFLRPLILLGLVGLFGVCIARYISPTPLPIPILGVGMMQIDLCSIAFTLLFSGILLLWFLLAQDYFQEETSLTDHYALILFVFVGAFVLVSYTNLVMLFLGIEILSIPLYVLAGSKKDSLLSNEAAFKYFLMGAFASAFLLFGIALIYGATATFDLKEIQHAIHSAPNASLSSQTFLLVGLLLILVGMGFKTALTPFHFWAPDVYLGSPTLITAFMATVVKVSAFAAFYRLLSMAFLPVESFFTDLLWGMIALTLVVGNLSAVAQTNVKRMLAFSSIAHAGFLAIPLLCISKTPSSGNTLFYYSLVYSIASLISFVGIYLVSQNTGNETRHSFSGLAKRNPLLAFVMSVALLSLAGIPPLGGFFAKYFMLTLALSQDHLILVLLAVLGSLIGIYYYFQILIAMYAKAPEQNMEPFILSFVHRIVLCFSALSLILIGIFPEAFLKFLP
jgi:NADH-quinone oxidoreductase subunit N